MSDFETKFEEMMDNTTLSWQTRLHYELCKSPDQWPDVIDLPTGLRKTMEMAIWLVTRLLHPELKLPTRFVYAVYRRPVVDLATDIATKLRETVGKKELVISTLCRQLADNREWTCEPCYRQQHRGPLRRVEKLG